MTPQKDKIHAGIQSCQESKVHKNSPGTRYQQRRQQVPSLPNDQYSSLAISGGNGGISSGSKVVSEIQCQSNRRAGWPMTPLTADPMPPRCSQCRDTQHYADWPMSPLSRCRPAAPNTKIPILLPCRVANGTAEPMPTPRCQYHRRTGWPMASLARCYLILPLPTPRYQYHCRAG